YVYGSVARGEATDDSDVDLLYRTEPGSPLNMMQRKALQAELERAFGREVSLTSLDSLQRRAQTSRASRRFYEHIQPDMVRVA
ncbi:MAG: nucleotidyltransferase domain-containing protein, partial [Eggerthellaceae bacterium]